MSKSQEQPVIVQYELFQGEEILQEVMYLNGFRLKMCDFMS